MPTVSGPRTCSFQHGILSLSTATELRKRVMLLIPIACFLDLSCVFVVVALKRRVVFQPMMMMTQVNSQCILLSLLHN